MLNLCKSRSYRCDGAGDAEGLHGMCDGAGDAGGLPGLPCKRSADRSIGPNIDFGWRALRTADTTSVKDHQVCSRKEKRPDG